jgi:hypothetical protein
MFVTYVSGLLSKVHAVVDGSQYELIRGLLAFNLGEQLESAESTAAGEAATSVLFVAF